MAVRNVAPTRTSLLTLKQELSFARLGHELLDQKRNILVNELLGIVDQAEEFQSRTREALAEAFHRIEEAVRRTGTVELERLAGAVNVSSRIELAERRVMGVRLPVVRTDYRGKPPWFSPAKTSVWVDAALVSFKDALELAGRLAELRVSIVRLAEEVKKTIRKVNALEKIAIPDLEETVGMIAGRLEENEREMFVLMKLVKSRLETKEQ
jgi:V/A-type H+/Na+-transporting ATPase subunit D